jgi:hypothetical protein
MHDAEMADIEMQIIQDAFDAGVETFCYFQLSGPGSQYGIWGTMPHITQAPYPIYNRLLAGIAGDKAVATLTLDDRVTDIERRLKAAGIG